MHYLGKISHFWRLMKPASWRSLRRVLRVAIPLTFVAVTAWTVVDLVSQGTPPRRPMAAETANSVEPGTVTIAVAADIGSDERAHATLEGMAAAQPDLHLALGDLSYAGEGSEREWCDLVRSKVGPVVPVQIVAGNHEEDTREDGFIENFAACLPDRMNAQGLYGREYYFDVGKVARIIMISPDLTIDGQHYFYGGGTRHHEWLVDAIDGARADGITWIVVGMHKNCISVGEYYCNVYQELFDLLIDKRVDLVLSGHEHSYQRSKQLAASSPSCPRVILESHNRACVVDDGADDEYVKGDGPVFLIAGMAGGELYDVYDNDPEAAYFAKVMGRNQEPRFGFVGLTLREADLTVEFMPSSPGDFKDRFVVR